MARAAGYLLILAGVGVASTLLPFGSDADSALRIPDVFSRWVGDDVPVVTIVPVEAPAVRVAGPAPAKPQAVAAPLPVSPTHVVVTLPPRSEHSAMVPHAVVGPGTDPAALARDLQRELRRVGCYSGDLNGVWSMTSRRAMKAFTDRVNAALPVDDARCDPALARQGASGRCLRQALSCARGARRGRALPADRGPGPPQQEGRTAWRTGEGQGTGRAARGRDQRLDDHGVGAAAAASCRGTARRDAWRWRVLRQSLRPRPQARRLPGHLPPRGPARRRRRVRRACAGRIGAWRSGPLRAAASSRPSSAIWS